MKKVGISLFLFTLAASTFFFSPTSFGQSFHGCPSNGKITINGDINPGQSDLRINGDSIIAEGKILRDSILKNLRTFKLPGLATTRSKHYFSKNGERYYIDIIPPSLRGKRVDDSDFWLLGAK